MLIRIFIFLVTFFIIFIKNALGFSIPVENVFSDININYKYYNELQTAYDKGMILPDSNGKFNPNKLLNRDEFVGISMEVSCKKCISPNVAPNFIDLYTNKVSFFDVLPQNKYFYCIAEAKDKKYIKGYDPGFTCENGSSKLNQIPFCPSNKISLEEAIAVVLRNSGIFTIADNAVVLNQIKSGVNFPDLSTDVKARNIDGSVNSFYPYLRKALTYEYRSVDINGNVKIYKLLEVKNGKIRPKKSITKEEFLRIAFVILKNNSCSTLQGNKLALKIKVFDKVCDATKVSCNLSNLSDNTNTYDFSQDVKGVCSKGVDPATGYIWRFYNKDTGFQIIKYQKYIDNYTFLDNGNWRVYLRVVDRCGNTGEVYNDIIISNNNVNKSNGLNLTIDASPIYGPGPLNSSFEGIISGGVGPYDFNWDFGDGNTGFGKTINNIFVEQGIYNVLLVVTDSNGLQAFATVNIQVILGQNCSIDSDSDGVNDCLDQCSLVPGDILNSGCPILDNFCVDNNSCQNNYICSKNGANTKGVCIPAPVPTNNLDNSLCIEQNSISLISGNVLCNSCPCSNILDFKAVVRKCDTIFPAITSPDGKEIYSKGEDFIIK